MSRTYCASMAKDAGFGATAYCGVEYGSQCWCAQTLDSDAKKTDENLCNMPCAGNSSEICGGPYVADVFRATCDVRPATGANVASVTAPTGSVPPFGIVQWSLTVEGVVTNPWEALNITLDLTPPKGGRPYNAIIKGYHQGGNEWRVRAALQDVGDFPYKLAVVQNGNALHSSSGTVVCAATAKAQLTSVGPRGFLRPQFGKFPYRTAFDDGTLFNGFGFGDCLNDDLTFQTYENGKTFTRSLDQYVKDYSDAGFNIFRWSDGNCAPRIQESFDGGDIPWRPNGNEYNETTAALLDRVFDTFRTNGFSMWSVIFSKDDNSKLPVFPYLGNNDKLNHLAQRASLGAYLDFVVARWGAQTDVWSLLNEQRGSPEWLQWMAQYLRSIDPYRHPISSSWNDHIEVPEIEINSVHWYHSSPVAGQGKKGTSNATQSDLAMADEVQGRLAVGKPVYYTETGMLSHNWDPKSHVLMRIRSWTAFFEACVLIWWNTANTQSYHGISGNMYLGPQERGYQKVLRAFMDEMTDPAVAQLNMTASDGVRAYGVTGASGDGKTKVLMAYAQHYSSHDQNITAQITFAPSEGFLSLTGCEGTWVHPDTGATEPATQPKGLTYTTPVFSIDMALRVNCPYQAVTKVVV